MNFLIDGLNIAFRAYCIYDLKQGLTNDEGMPTGLLFGFLKILMKWKNLYPRHNFVVVWDRRGGKQARQDKYAGYKANRDGVTPLPDDDTAETGEDAFSVQLTLLRGFLKSLGVAQASAPCREADDVIAYLIRNDYKDAQNIILTSDRDMLQLVTRKTIMMTPEGKVYDPDKVVEEYGVTPDLLLQYRALKGDTSDNLPGLPRFRKKVIASLVNEFGSVEDLYNQDLSTLDLTKKEKEKLEEFRNQAQVNLDVMAFFDDAPGMAYVPGEYDHDTIQSSCDFMKFESIREQLLRFNETPQQGLLKFYELHSTD